jgi:hypothetical protein
MSGATYAQIAQQVGYSDHSGARKAVWRAIDQIIPSSQLVEWRQYQTARLEFLIASLWKRAIGDECNPADLAAIREVGKLMDQQTRLLGLAVRPEAPRARESLESSRIDRLSSAEKQRIVDAEMARVRSPSRESQATE